MTANKISVILKQYRNSIGYTPEKVVSLLAERGINISTKALYAYESGTNLPKVPVFLTLCDIYQIRDIMGSFGYTASLCIGENEWEDDQYQDFFNATLYEKIFLLAQWGIPSFDDYQELMTQPAQIVLSDDEIKVVKMYRSLSLEAKDRIVNSLRYECKQATGKDTSPIARQA